MPVPPIGQDILQQATAFRPFMRKLICFSEIACRTGCNNVRDIIATSFRKWNYVVCMPYKILLSMLLLAIIASRMLALQLFQKLLRGERITAIMVRYATFMTDGFSNRFPFFTLLIGFTCLFPMIGTIILSTICSSFFRVFMIILNTKSPMFFSMRLIIFSIICSSIFQMILLPLGILSTSLIFMGLIIGLVLLTCACSTYVSKSMLLFAEGGKWEELPTCTTLFALRGVRRYTSIHGRTHFLSSRLRMFAALLSQHIFTSTVYHKTPSQATLHPSFCLFYRDLEV